MIRVNRTPFRFSKFGAINSSDMKKIELTKGYFALVDDADYDWLMKWKWCASVQRSNVYAVRKSNPCNIKMHRQIIGAPTGLMVDHIDHNGLNNQRDNLRLCNNSDNHKNSRPKGISRYLGVSFRKDRNKFEAYIKTDEKYIHLGHYVNEVDAAMAYDLSAKKYHGEFANLNFKS